jgi:membrane bound O-acyltransferase family protein
MDYPIAQTHRERVYQFWDRYDKAIESKEVYAFGYPYGLVTLAIILGYLSIPGSTVRRNYGKYVAWLAMMIWCSYITCYTRARYTTAAALTGLTHSWLILWSTAHFLFNDPKRDYLRIKRVYQSQDTAVPAKENGSTTAHDVRSSNLVSRDQSKSIEKDEEENKSPAYIWQPFPNTMSDRLDWASELITSLDGMGWSWAIRSLPPPPSQVQASLARQNLDLPIDEAWKTSTKSMQKRKEQTWNRILQRFILTFLALDIIKTLISLDPYFWGYVDHPAPPYLPVSWQSSPVIAKSCRLLIAQAATYAAVRAVLGLRPMLYILRRQDKSLGVRTEAWMFPDDFGHYSAVYQHGLGGFWSSFWHQSFRYVFETPALALIRVLNMDPRSIQARTIRICIAFVCSGFMHGCLSYSSVGESTSIHGSFLFFILQPIGIFVQYFWLRYFRSTTVSKHCPTIVGYIANIVFVNMWFYFTAPLFVEDLAIGGWFLFEPCAFSILRGLGLGAPDDGFNMMHGRWATWRVDSWRTGIAT